MESVYEYLVRITSIFKVVLQSTIFITCPAPTVRPLSRMAKRMPVVMARGVAKSKRVLQKKPVMLVSKWFRVVAKRPSKTRPVGKTNSKASSSAQSLSSSLLFFFFFYLFCYWICNFFALAKTTAASTCTTIRSGSSAAATAFATFTKLT